MDVQLLSSRFVSFRALSCIASVPGSSISPDPEPKALLSQISLTLCLTNTSYSLEVMAHTFNQQKQVDLYEFEAILVYIMISRPPRGTRRGHVSK